MLYDYIHLLLMSLLQLKVTLRVQTLYWTDGAIYNQRSVVCWCLECSGPRIVMTNRGMYRRMGYPSGRHSVIVVRGLWKISPFGCLLHYHSTLRSLVSDSPAHSPWSQQCKQFAYIHFLDNIYFAKLGYKLHTGCFRGNCHTWVEH